MMTKEKFTLTSLTAYLNEHYKKQGYKGSEMFTPQDVQGYISRGILPTYLEQDVIIFVKPYTKIAGAKLYELVESKK